MDLQAIQAELEALRTLLEQQQARIVALELIVLNNTQEENMEYYGSELERNDDADGKAREQLADEMHQIGVHSAVVIWPDINSAYLDSDNMEEYQKIAEHFKVEYDADDLSPVKDALFNRYETLFEKILAE